MREQFVVMKAVGLKKLSFYLSMNSMTGKRGIAGLLNTERNKSSTASLFENQPIRKKLMRRQIREGVRLFLLKMGIV